MTKGQAPLSPAQLAAIAQEATTDLRGAATVERGQRQKRYLKSDLYFLGAPMDAITGVSLRLAERTSPLDHDRLLAITAELWSHPVHELRMLAVKLLERHLRLLEPEDLHRIEGWLRESRTWALLDPLAINVAGPLLEGHANRSALRRRWANDDDFWVRRAALLSFLLQMRKGDDVFAEFSRHAGSMVGEREFFIRKAIGWVLRERSKRQPEEVYEWLLPRARELSGLTFREASKYLGAQQRAHLIARRARG